MRHVLGLITKLLKHNLATNYDSSKLIVNLPHIQNISRFHFHCQRSTKSEERLESFLDPEDNKECPILLTVGHFIEGFDVEMILVVELHQILAKWFLSCSRKKLGTVVINEAAHPALLHQFQVPKVKVSF